MQFYIQKLHAEITYRNFMQKMYMQMQIKIFFDFFSDIDLIAYKLTYVDIFLH